MKVLQKPTSKYSVHSAIPEATSTSKRSLRSESQRIKKPTGVVDNEVATSTSERSLRSKSQGIKKPTGVFDNDAKIGITKPTGTAKSEISYEQVAKSSSDYSLRSRIKRVNVTNACENVVPKKIPKQIRVLIADETTALEKVVPSAEEYAVQGKSRGNGKTIILESDTSLPSKKPLTRRKAKMQMDLDNTAGETIDTGSTRAPIVEKLHLNRDTDDVNPDLEQKSPSFKVATEESSEKEKLTSAALGQSFPQHKRVPTYQLMRNPAVLKRSMKYLNDLKDKRITHQDLFGMFRMPADDENDEVLEGLLAPQDKIIKSDSTSGSKDATDNTGISENKVLEAAANSGNSLIVKTSKPCFEGFDEDEEAADLLVRELASRLNRNNTDMDLASNEPMSDRAMEFFIQGYAAKKVAVTEHAEIIKALTNTDLEEKFEEIREDLETIRDGKGCSQRHNIFVGNRLGVPPRRLLAGYCVSVPFTNIQACVLISKIYDVLFPKVSERVQYLDYAAFVMLPETFIRIYSNTTGLTFKQAEREMLCGATYEDDDE